MSREKSSRLRCTSSWNSLLGYNRLQLRNISTAHSPPCSRCRADAYVCRRRPRRRSERSTPFPAAAREARKFGLAAATSNRIAAKKADLLEALIAAPSDKATPPRPASERRKVNSELALALDAPLNFLKGVG